MTDKEAKAILIDKVKPCLNGTEWEMALDIAIKALGQEPMLDKIRAEIELLSNANPSYWHSGDMVEREEVLDIIDEYRG